MLYYEDAHRRSDGYIAVAFATNDGTFLSLVLTDADADELRKKLKQVLKG